MIAQEKPLIDKLINLSLPPLPESALRVVKLTSDLNTSARTIAAAISADPGLTTFILRIANSVMYGTDKKITSLLDAVNRLGDRVIYQSVIGFVFSTTLKNKKASSKLENTLWEHSICVALAARQISLLWVS